MDEFEIREAIYRLLRLQEEIKEARLQAGKAFKAANRKGAQIVDLSRLYKISRPKIYWLMNEYERSESA